MKYLKHYGENEIITENKTASADEILHRIRNTKGGCSLPGLIKSYNNSAELMTILDQLTNSGQVELTGGKYKFVKH